MSLKPKRGRKTKQQKDDENKLIVPVATETPVVIGKETVTVPPIAEELFHLYNLSYKNPIPENVRKVFNIHNELFPDFRESKIFCKGCAFRVYERVRAYLRNYELIK